MCKREYVQLHKNQCKLEWIKTKTTWVTWKQRASAICQSRTAFNPLQLLTSPSYPGLCRLLSISKKHPSFPLELHSYSRPRKCDQSATDIITSVFRKITKELNWDQTRNYSMQSLPKLFVFSAQIPKATSSLHTTPTINPIFPTLDGSDTETEDQKHDPYIPQYIKYQILNIYSFIAI